MNETERLAAALALVLFEGHPIYASTAGWRGGIGGQSLTPSCSLIDPPPRDEWMDGGLGAIQKPLHDYLDAHPEFDLAAAKAALTVELKALYESWVRPGVPGDQP